MRASTSDNNDNDDNNKDDISYICANCGKGEENGNTLKACTACKLVKYCNRECQIAHRPQHKKTCKKRAAELHDEKLFKQPPPAYEDCPICFLRLPSSDSGYKFMVCCGKVLCSGCVHAPVYDDKGNVVAKKSCPFCRTPKSTTDKETISRVKELMEAGNAMAIRGRGDCYARGWYGLPQDTAKALELWHQAGKLGNAISYHNIGCIYDTGEGVELDKKKARHYYELAAIGGYVKARHNLGRRAKAMWIGR